MLGRILDKIMPHTKAFEFNHLILLFKGNRGPNSRLAYHGVE